MLKELTDLSKEEGGKPTPPQDKSWISNMTFQTMRKKTEALKEGNSEEVKRLGKEVRRNRQRDQWQQIGKVADHIKSHMKKKDKVVKLNKTKEVYNHLFQKVQLPVSTAKSQRETIFKTIQDKLEIQVNFSIKIMLKMMENYELL